MIALAAGDLFIRIIRRRPQVLSSTDRVDSMPDIANARLEGTS
jgi:hypothetical protein